MKILVTIVIVAFSFHSIGCEVCGSSAAGSIGIIGSSNNHLIGFSCVVRSFNSTHPDIFGHGNVENSSEFFMQVNLLAKFQLSKRFQLYANVPMVYNQQRKEGKTSIAQGLGDVTLSTRFLAYATVDSIRKRTFGIQVGAGVKAPIGAFSSDAHATTNMYPGTGSWDFPLMANLFFQTEKWNVQFENTFNMTTENVARFKFGNGLQSVAYAGRTLKYGGMRISPGIGMQFDYLFLATINGSSKNTFNGGHILTTLPGMNVEFNRVFISVRYFQPLTQYLSKGYTKNNGQLSFSIFYTFKTISL